MYLSYQFREMSEIERAQLVEGFSEELEHLREIQSVLEEALYDYESSKNIYSQRIKAKKLEAALEGRIRQVQLDKQLKVLKLSLKEMRIVRKALKKRIISQIEPKKLTAEIAFLEEKVKDEILRDECGLKRIFKGVLVSQKEMNILLETIAI